MDRGLSDKDRTAVFLTICFVPGVFLGLRVSLWLSLPAAMLALPLGIAFFGRVSSRRIELILLAILLGGTGTLTGIRGKECGLEEFHWGFAESCCCHLKNQIDGIGFEDELTPVLLKAFLTGDRTKLDKDTKELFRKSGAAHLLALSGLHLGIIYLILSSMLSLGGGTPAVRRSGAVLLIGLTAFYTLMTGASPSIVRAFLFIFLRESGRLLGRHLSLMRCWCIALVLQLGISPASILLPGFQLSYLAMLGICLLMSPLQAIFPRTKGVKGPIARIWDIAALSLSCQAFTAPLSWKLFASFPQFFLITNLLCMPLMSILMICAIACIVLSTAGTCPQLLIKATEYCCGLLIHILEIVCQM